MAGLMRHWQAVRNVTLPGTRAPFFLGDARVGWVQRREIPLLLRLGCVAGEQGVVLEQSSELPHLSASLAEARALVLRGEEFDVRAVPGGRVLATLDRGALPWFGVLAEGVHVNGLVRRADGLHIWVARRAADRLMDPGKLDHLFAGGIAAGSTPEATLLKEGAEEAGLPPEIASRAIPAGIVDYVTERPEGLRRDRLHCYDLWLPETIQPVPNDGEVDGFALWPIGRVIETLRETDDFKFNVALVLIDLLRRQGLAADDDLDTAAPSAPGGGGLVG